MHTDLADVRFPLEGGNSRTASSTLLWYSYGTRDSQFDAACHLSAITVVVTHWQKQSVVPFSLAVIEPRFDYLLCRCYSIFVLCREYQSSIALEEREEGRCSSLVIPSARTAFISRDSGVERTTGINRSCMSFDRLRLSSAPHDENHSR